jgi:hypothetical protein
MDNHDPYSDNDQTLERELVPIVRQEIGRHEAMSLCRPSGRGSHSYRGPSREDWQSRMAKCMRTQSSMRTVRVIPLFTCR